MEQIVKVNGIYYYGEQQCKSVDDAYRRFRGDYHRSIGKAAYKRLGRLGQRKERIHGYGFVFSDGVLEHDYRRLGRVRYRASLVLMCYCRIFGRWDMPDIPDGEFDRWFDWALSRGSGALRLVGITDKSGRTSKRLNTRYR